MPHDILGLIIEPMLAPARMELVGYCGTAQGPNRFYELWKRGKDVNFPDWESYTIKASSCNLFSHNALWDMQNSMTAAEYAQEMECDFNANVLVGSVYGEFMRRFTRTSTILMNGIHRCRCGRRGI
jgi:hypothetical protein